MTSSAPSTRPQQPSSKVRIPLGLNDPIAQVNDSEGDSSSSDEDRKLDSRSASMSRSGDRRPTTTATAHPPNTTSSKKDPHPIGNNSAPPARRGTAHATTKEKESKPAAITFAGAFNQVQSLNNSNHSGGTAAVANNSDAGARVGQSLTATNATSSTGEKADTADCSSVPTTALMSPRGSNAQQQQQDSGAAPLTSSSPHTDSSSNHPPTVSNQSVPNNTLTVSTGAPRSARVTFLAGGNPAAIGGDVSSKSGTSVVTDPSAHRSSFQLSVGGGAAGPVPADGGKFLVAAMGRGGATPNSSTSVPLKREHHEILHSPVPGARRGSFGSLGLGGGGGPPTSIVSQVLSSIAALGSSVPTFHRRKITVAPGEPFSDEEERIEFQFSVQQAGESQLRDSTVDEEEETEDDTNHTRTTGRERSIALNRDFSNDDSAEQEDDAVLSPMNRGAMAASMGGPTSFGLSRPTVRFGSHQVGDSAQPPPNKQKHSPPEPLSPPSSPFRKQQRHDLPTFKRAGSSSFQKEGSSAMLQHLSLKVGDSSRPRSGSSNPPSGAGSRRGSSSGQPEGSFLSSQQSHASAISSVQTTPSGGRFDLPQFVRDRSAAHPTSADASSRRGLNNSIFSVTSMHNEVTVYRPRQQPQDAQRNSPTAFSPQHPPHTAHTAHTRNQSVFAHHPANRGGLEMSMCPVAPSVLDGRVSNVGLTAAQLARLQEQVEQRRRIAEAEAKREREEEAQRKHREVMERAANRKRFAAEDRAQQLRETQMRNDMALARKQFVETHKLHQRSCIWASLVHMINFMVFGARRARMIRSREVARKALLPRCYLLIHRALRRARLRLSIHGVNRPSLAAVKNDKMFAMFSDSHLMHMIERMTLRYYFPNETIIFMGCEDDEGYFLHSGTADVLMGKVKVFTMTSGMVFGTVGMISGEPRTATIVAREPCLVWTITRRDFDSYGSSDHQVAAAQKMIADFRQQNLRKVYKNLIAIETLLKFPILHDVSADTAERLLSYSVPVVYRNGEQLHHPGCTVMDMSYLYVLRGRLRILRRTSGSSLSNFSAAAPTRTKFVTGDRSTHEQLALMIDLLTKRQIVGNVMVDTLEALGKAYEDRKRQEQRLLDQQGGEAGGAVVMTQSMMLPPGGSAQVGGTIREGFELVAEVSGPLLFNVASFFLQEVPPFVVETVGGCDALLFRRETIVRQDILELATMRQNSLNIHSNFIKRLPKSQLLRTIFNGSLAFSFFNQLKRDPVVQTPWVYAPDSQLLFDTTTEMDALIILSGQLEQPRSGDPKEAQNAYGAPTGAPKSGATAAQANSGETFPYLWPEVHLVYFGCVRCIAKTKTRVECIRIRRATLLEWLFSELSDADLTTFATAITTQYVVKTAKRPVLSDFGFAAESASLANSSRSSAALNRRGSEANSRAMNAGLQRYRSFRALNVRTAQAANVVGATDADDIPTTTTAAAGNVNRASTSPAAKKNKAKGASPEPQQQQAELPQDRTGGAGKSLGKMTVAEDRPTSPRRGGWSKPPEKGPHGRCPLFSPPPPPTTSAATSSAAPRKPAVPRPPQAPHRPSPPPELEDDAEVSGARVQQLLRQLYAPDQQSGGDQYYGDGKSFQRLHYAQSDDSHLLPENTKKKSATARPSSGTVRSAGGVPRAPVAAGQQQRPQTASARQGPPLRWSHYQ